MSEAKIRQILQLFDAESFLEDGLQCGNSPQKWEQFIKNEFIAQERVDEFRERLFDMGILQKSDILFRRVSLKSYFDQIGIANKDLGTKHAIFKIIRQMSFSDFIICVIKFSKQKGRVSALISQQGIPIPLAFQLQESLNHDTDAIFKIVGAKEFHLILIIGTPKVRKSGKTSFLAKLFSLKEQFNQESHAQNILNLYTKISLEKRQNFLLADFNGQVSTSLEIIDIQQQSFYEFLINLQEYSILHTIEPLLIYCWCYYHNSNILAIREINKTWHH